MNIKTAIGISLIVSAAMLIYTLIMAVMDNPWLLLIPAVPAVGIGGWVLYSWAAMVNERLLLARAERKQKEWGIQSDGFGMLHLINYVTNHSQNLTLDARAYRNGHYEPPTQSETDNLRYILASRHAGSAKQMMVEQPTTPQLPAPSLDFYEVLSDPLQAYAVIGPQRIGKSVLIQQLTAHFVRQNQRVVVIGTKAGPSEWAGCERYIGGPDDASVPDALEMVYQEAEQRIKANINWPLTAVILDDWLNTSEVWPEIAERFFVEAATRMLTAGIVPYFILQSDSKSDWGIKHGAQLKNNFTHVWLRAPRQNGRINHAELKVSVIYPGEKTPHAIRLPYGAPVPAMEVLSPQEARVLEMLDGGSSVTAIAKAVFGGDGGNQLGRVREIIANRKP
jgi:hypothetical protein